MQEVDKNWTIMPIVERLTKNLLLYIPTGIYMPEVHDLHTVFGRLLVVLFLGSTSTSYSSSPVCSVFSGTETVFSLLSVRVLFCCTYNIVYAPIRHRHLSTYLRIASLVRTPRRLKRHTIIGKSTAIYSIGAALHAATSTG